MSWVRDDIIFFTEHGSSLTYLKRFRLARNDVCACGGRYRNSIPLCHKVHSYDLLVFKETCTKSNIRMSGEEVASNNLSRHKIHKIIKFIS
ncbi:hypothetical protein AVEN_155038-1 [Araneus ventricosus]|uniref:Uncharacterized protein n=1 Tax=Araneus ventricosus TaxID=182803 RepID=A0A4Y2A7D0_ARAVE|nr:hypothetical protein AVEN_155038-1 [Araneus ventricosus]